MVTDHMTVTHLMQLKDPYHQLARWALEIASYNVNLVHEKGVNIPHVDALSRNPEFMKLEDETSAKCISKEPIRSLRWPITMATEEEIVQDEPIMKTSAQTLEEFRKAQLNDTSLKERILFMEQHCKPEEGSNNIYQCSISAG